MFHFLLYLMQVVILHHMLSKATMKQRPSVLWCFKKELGFSTYLFKHSHVYLMFERSFAFEHYSQGLFSIMQPSQEANETTSEKIKKWRRRCE